MKSFFIFDVESVGLHGDAFAVAGGVYLENGAAQWEFQFCCPTNECSDPSDLEWVRNNVPVMEITHRSAPMMRDAFWDVWMKAKAQGAQMAAECLWPVEARLVLACVNDDLASRKWEGPYPFHEISSIMLSAGMDAMKNYERSPSESPAHHPLSDARLSARLLAQALSKLSEK